MEEQELLEQQSQPETPPSAPNDQNSTGQPEPVQEKPQEPYNLAEKESQVESKRKKFLFTVKIAFFAFVALILLSVTMGMALNLYNEKKKPYIADDVPPDRYPVQNKDKITDILYDNKALYKSDLFRLSLKYPERAKLVEKEVEGTNPQKLVISHDDFVFEKNYDPDKEIAEITKELPEVTENTLEQGFIFKITLLDLPRNLDEVSRIKQAAFKSNCPQTAVISDVYGLAIDEIASAAFKVANCGGVSYKVYYVPRFGIYFEIQQIYAGDIGYRQKFEVISEDILNSIDFYPSAEEIHIEQPYTTKIIDNLKFTFRYSSELTEGCCPTDVPVANKSLSPIMNMGKASDTDSNRNDKIALFFYDVKKTKDKRVFMEKFQEQQNLLINDYKLVTGQNADTKITEIMQNGKTIYKLEGYTWQGYDLYYFSTDGSNMVVIVVDNKSGDSFEKYIKELIESIEFF